MEVADGSRRLPGEVRRPNLAAEPSTSRESAMLWTIAVILIVLWAVGLVSSYTMHGFIHLLLILAVVTILIRIIQGRKVV
jgi:hypothetical protein